MTVHVESTLLDDAPLSPKLRSPWQKPSFDVRVEKLKIDHAQALEICEAKRLKASAANEKEDSLPSNEGDDDDDDEEETVGHDHHEKPKSFWTAFASAIIQFLLMFGLCCSFGMIMFEHDWNSRHRGMAVKMNLATALIAGLIVALFSKVPIAIGGPDMHPVIFIGMMTTTLSEELAKANHLVYPDVGGRRLLDEYDLSDTTSFLRQLGGGGTGDTEFCIDDHYLLHAEDCDNYHAQLAATTIFTVAVSSAILGLIFVVLGKFKLTRLVMYVPTNIMEAFLSCVGYKVFKYALKFCKYEPRHFIPAACIGVPLYFVKALQIGKPSIAIPTMLLLPVAIFYGVLYGIGGDIASARKDGWFFAEIDNADFWAVWRDGLTPFSEEVSFAGNIKFAAWSKTLVDLPIMILVCLMDSLVQLSSTENKIPVHPDKDYEMQIFGAANILTTLCGSSVGYMQLKFNVINYGVVGNISDRRGGIMYALLCGICFFWTTDFFNYLPRFFLSTLLFFKGSGFVAENLWGSRRYLSLQEWLQIFFILAVFIATGSLLYAVLTGCLLAGGSFIAGYAKIPCIQGHPLRGGQVVCSQRQPLLMQYNICHVANSTVMVIRLKGYIFFASAQRMATWVAKHFEDEYDHELPDYRRLRWVIFECGQLDAMDSSASKCLAKLVKAAYSVNVRILWSGMSKAFLHSLQRSHTIKGNRDWFDTLDDAMQFTHNKIAERIVLNQSRWIHSSPMFEIAYAQQHLRMDSDPFAGILPTDEQRFGCPWAYCGRHEIKACETLLWKPGTCKELFLICSGQVGVFKTFPDTGKKWDPPHAIYNRGWFLNRQAILHHSQQTYGVALRDGEIVFWSELQWDRLTRERPRMANAILKAIWLQEARDSELTEAETLSYVGIGDDDDDLEGIEDHVIEDHDAHAHLDCDSHTTHIVTHHDNHADPDSPKHMHDEEEVEEDEPFELMHEHQGFAIAQACEDLGLFMPVDASEEISFPALPSQINEDIDTAFNTMAEHNAEGGFFLQSGQLVEALTYAGIYDFALGKICRDKISRNEFKGICERALLAPLSKSMASKLRLIFQEACKDGTETLDRSDFVNLIKAIFKYDIPADDVGGVANMWGTSFGGRIDVEAYFAVVARFVAKHMKDWLILKGIRQLMGPGDTDRTTITADMLVNARLDLSKEAAEEMIWSACYCAGLGDGKEIDFRMLAAILLTGPSKPSRIPPAPKRIPAVRNVGMKLNGKKANDMDQLWRIFEDESELPQVKSTGETQAIIAPTTLKDTSVVELNIRNMDDDDDSSWFRSVVIDLRSNDNKSLEYKPPPRVIIKNFDSSSRVSKRRSSLSSSTGLLLKAKTSWRTKIWLLLDDPNSSHAANRISLVMGIMILVSALTLFLEPLVSPKNANPSDTEKTVWLIFEAFFTGIFTIEYLMKFWACTTKMTRCSFLRDPMNICDLIAVMPFYVDQTIDTDKEEFRLFRIVRLMRLSRLVRLGRLAKRSATFAPIAMILVVIWGIYMQNGLKEKD